MNECTICHTVGEFPKITEEEIKTHVQSGTQFNIKDLHYVTCTHCGTTYQPKPQKEKLTKLYAANYKKKYTLKKELFLRLPYSTHYSHKLKYVSDLPKGTVLDVGCSEGKWLYLLRKRGWSVEGLEPSDCAEKARKIYGHKVHRCTLEDYHTDKQYQLVSCLATLEHVFNPEAFFEKLANLVKKDGFLFIVVPTRSYCAEHITFLTPYAMMLLGRQNNLDIIRMDGLLQEKIIILYRKR